MNKIQFAIFVGAKEESGIWEVIMDVCGFMGVTKGSAFELIKNEFDFINSHEEIYLVYSEQLYDSENCKVLPKNNLLSLTLFDVEFHEEGPFYYISSFPGI